MQRPAATVPSLTFAPSSLTTHRHAYLISSGGERGRSAAALLRSVGFSVTRLPPVVLAPHHLRLLPPRWSGRLTSNASGLQWVKRSFSCMLTQRLAYEKMARRHAANATARHRFEYIFEDDVALHPSLTSRSLLSPLLDAAESTAHAGRADLVYLGGCRTYRRQPIGRAALWRVALSNGTSVEMVGLSRCAVMCTHAYGVATAAAGGLFARLSRALGPLFAPAMDQNLFRYVSGLGVDGRGLPGGAAVAASGRGLQSNDDPSIANGGNCYACHQLAPTEVAYGTLGPSLTQYGLRGQSDAMLRYTWTKLWDTHAFNLCSHMPRFGAQKILTEQQLKDVMAFLLDPNSSVNPPTEGSSSAH